MAEVTWYHTIDLGNGEATPGRLDHRPIVHRVPLPDSLAGKRCLDVGTWDGFWAFEMERRGAEVVAVDIDDQTRWDWPPRARLTGAVDAGSQYLDHVRARDAGFRLARERLGSRVERVDASVYELDPERIGRFDLVFLGSLLLHLRDPVGALERIRSVCTGELVVADAVEAVRSWRHPRLPMARLEAGERPWWWQPNRAALLRMVRSAGFEIVESTGVFFVPTGAGHKAARVREVLAGNGRLERLVLRARGMPHVALRARPGIAGGE